MVLGHLKRHFQSLAAHPDHQVERLGHDLLRPTQELFRLWANCSDGPLARRQFRRRMEPVRERIENLLLRGVFSGNPRPAGTCRELHAHRAWLWSIAGVEPTNAAAERSMRHAMI